MGIFDVLNRFKEVVETNVNAFEVDYNEEPAKNEVNEDNTESGEDILVCVVSVGENKEAVVQFLCEEMGWESDDAEKFIADVPDYLFAYDIEEASYFEQELHKLGANAHIVEDDEWVYLKISSLGNNKELVINFVSAELYKDLEETRIWLSKLPVYVWAPIEAVEKGYKKLSDLGAEVTIIGKADFEAEEGMDDEDDELSNLRAKSNIRPIGGETKRYVCPVCGWVYDEAVGIRFEDLPNGFVCPSCHVGKNLFSEMTNSLPAQSMVGNATRTQKCGRCGADIIGNEKFCPNCGKKVETLK